MLLLGNLPVSSNEASLCCSYSSSGEVDMYCSVVRQKGQKKRLMKKTDEHTKKPLQILPQRLCQENISIQEGMSAALLYDIMNVFPTIPLFCGPHLLSLALCQDLMAASLTSQTHSPPIIAPAEFTVCVTCRPKLHHSPCKDLRSMSQWSATSAPTPPTPNSQRETPGGKKTPQGGNI